jgi:hypothetical protein
VPVAALAVPFVACSADHLPTFAQTDALGMSATGR